VDMLDVGEYKFNLVSDDGASLHIDKELVIANDGIHKMNSATGTIFLGPGNHDLEILYFQGPAEMGIILRWSGGPQDFSRRVMDFAPKWYLLRLSPAEPTCELKAPSSNADGVPVSYGQIACHPSCMTCTPGSEAGTDCTTCNPAYTYFTVLNAKLGTGTCTKQLCPLCKPRECCDEKHAHFVIDQSSLNGVCMKHSDECAPHCISYHNLDKNTQEHICTKGCNQLIKLAIPREFLDISTLKPGEELKPKFDVIICQAEKMVTCVQFKGTPQSILSSSDTPEYSILPLMGEGSGSGSTALVQQGSTERTCSTEKTVQCAGVCPSLTDVESARIYSAGGTCTLDVIPKLECDREPATSKCITSSGGAFTCQAKDAAPLACSPDVIGYMRDFLACSCFLKHTGPDKQYCTRPRDEKACKIIASSF